MRQVCYPGRMKTWRITLIILKITLVAMLMSTELVQGEIYLENNGYKNVLITINPDAKIEQQDKLLDNIQKSFTEASAVLFRATKNRVHFKEITVLVPEKWKTTKAHKALKMPLHRPDIIIDTPNPAYGNAPYVKQYGECGTPGLHMHLTPDYLLNETVALKWGKPDKTLVHEWAHLRWGLFDEYPIDDQDAQFYRYQEKWHPTRCTEEVNGSVQDALTGGPCYVNATTGEPDPNCRFVPNSANNKAAGSIMFIQYLESVMEFCDSSDNAPSHLRHNYNAPNRQNRLCVYRSAWEVMREHEDFSNNTQPLPGNTNTEPAFRFIQSQPQKRVLVLDTSSCNFNSIFKGKMLLVMKNYIESVIETESELGIVEITSSNVVLANLTKVTNDGARQQLVNQLHKLVSVRNRNITNGLEKGIEVLEQAGDAYGGSIILATANNHHVECPLEELKDVQNHLLEKGIVVHTFIYGKKANANKTNKKREKSRKSNQWLAELSKQTGGSTVYYSSQRDFEDGLVATVAVENSASLFDVPQTILTIAAILGADGDISGEFYTDDALGRETSITTTYDNNGTVSFEGTITTNFELRKTCAKCGQNEQFNFKRQPGIVKAGQVLYTIHNPTETPLHLTINVRSKPRSKETAIVTSRSWIDGPAEMTFHPKQKFGVFAEVMRGTAPVLGTKVWATVERPGTDIPLVVELFDMGNGADIIKDDGIYGAYILATDFIGNGSYNVKVEVIGTEGQVNVVEGNAGKASGANTKDYSETRTATKLTALGNFQRVTSGGTFYLSKFPDNTRREIPDLIPPARLTDVQVTALDALNFVVSVMWTATGGNMERGTASRYCVYVVQDDFRRLLSNQRSDIRLTQEDVLKGNLSQPKPSGSLEQMDMKLTLLRTSKTIFFGVTAIDHAGNEGFISNIISLSVTTKFADTSAKSKPVGLDPTARHLAIGLPLGISMLLVVIIGVVVLIRKRGNSKSHEYVYDDTLAQ